MHSLPHVVTTRVNQGLSVSGSFIDSEWVLHVILDGSWTFSVRGHEYVVERDDMVLLPPRLLHLVTPLSGEPLAQGVVHFLVHESATELKDAPLIVRTVGAQRRAVEQAFRELHGELSASDPGAPLRRSGLAVWLLGAYLRCAGREAVPARVSTPGQVAAERAVAFIQKQHHRVDLDLGDIAKEARVSEAYLCRVFRKVTGMTPRSYLNAFRIERSQLLLHEGRLNCTEIADTCGFSSVHHFSKVFKQLHGVAPTHWRSSLR